jgi:acyl-CoA reductase-like NAD-dependent aldehyde dehydrogenase
LADLAFTSHDPEVEELVERARAAIREFESWPEDRVDHLLLLLAQTIAVEAKSLAEATVRITRMGNVPDKVAKNLMASLGVYRHLVGQTGGGALATDQERKVIELASPAGVVFGLVPMTNPVATAIFKSLVALKGRNALILSFHRVAAELAAMVGERLQSVLRAEGAPVDLIQWVRQRNSRKKTELFMRHPKVSLILATGGASMVRAAYSSGTPAIGVGPGNAPTLVCRDADLDHAAASVVLSKSFDNGLICGSDNNLVAVAATVLELTDALVRHRAAVLAPEETERLTAQAVQPDSHRLRGKFIGQSAAWICEQVGIGRDYPIRAIVVPTEAVRADNVYACEKMAPIVSLFTVADEDDGLALSLALLQLEGAGHTAIIHTRNPELVQRFGALMPASRILVNSPGSQGVIGFTTGLVPSLMLGCGTFGHTSTTDNISLRHLINIKRIAHFTL